MVHFKFLALEGRKEKNNPFIVKISGLTLIVHLTKGTLCLAKIEVPRNSLTLGVKFIYCKLI